MPVLPMCRWDRCERRSSDWEKAFLSYASYARVWWVFTEIHHIILHAQTKAFTLAMMSSLISRWQLLSRDTQVWWSSCGEKDSHRNQWHGTFPGDAHAKPKSCFHNHHNWHQLRICQSQSRSCKTRLQTTVQLMRKNGRIALQTAQTCKHANTASMLLPQALRCMLGQLFATKVSVLLSSAYQICGVASATQVVTSHHKSQFPASWSEVQRVRLSRKSCMIKVESL